MRGLVLVLLGCAVFAPAAAAQVELDGSLGTTSGLVPGGLLPDGSTATYLIEESYGRRSGPNLFHSFSRFSIPNARSAAFTGDPEIERVIGRVTGGSVSLIDGTLRNTIEGADLYLLNPRGFVFSGTASLDLRGSLYLSSADTLRFDDGGAFSTMPSSGEVLSFAPPSAWGFTAATIPGTIRFHQARNLSVPQGETLEVAGGPVIVSGSLPRTTTLLAPGGTIALASRSEPGEVPVEVAQLSTRDAIEGEFGAVSIGSNALLDVSDATNTAPSRGRIVIRGQSLTITSSGLRGDSAVDASGTVADIDLETTSSIALRASSLIGVAARGTARGGGVRLSSEAITLSGASAVATTASAAALAGTLEVSGGSLQLSEVSRLTTSATGDATVSRVAVDARTIGLTSGAEISSVNGAATDAPDVEISVEDVLQIESGANLVTQTQAVGRGASLRIAARSVEQSTGGRIESSALGSGAGGDLEIEAEIVEMDGDLAGFNPGGVFARSLGSGEAGHVLLTADEVMVAGGAQISATAEGAGRGGDIEIAASRRLDLVGSSAVGPSGVFARSGLGPGTTATGDGGTIFIEALVVVVSDGAEISAQTFGSGNAIGIHIVAAESVRVAGGAASHSSISAKTSSSGAGGSVEIETGDLRIDDGGDITASTLYTGDSGDIRIEADRVYVGGGAPSATGPAGVFAQSVKDQTETIAAGAAGNIDIAATSRVDLSQYAVISVRSASSKDAGSIRIVAPIVIVADGAEISAQTGSLGDSSADGRGGDIEIDAADLLEIQSSGAIRVRTFGPGEAGVIAISGTQEVTIESGEISARSSSSGKAGSVALDGVGELFIGEGGSITTATLDDGFGGPITIYANSQVLVANGGAISAVSAGAGNAGSIAIDAGHRFSLRNGGQVTTSAVVANGGDIAIGASRLIYIEDGKVTTDVRAGIGSGGNITLDPEFVVLNHAELRASATGDGGNITIQTNRYVRDVASVVDASSQLGIDGEIQTTSPTVDLTSELAQLDTTFLDASSKLTAACAARAADRGTFAVRGRAPASNPDSPLDSGNHSLISRNCTEFNRPP